MSGQTSDEGLLAESQRILEAARREGVLLRLMGGLAVRIHAQKALPMACQRSYADVDFASTRRHRKNLLALFDTMGYESKEPFNTMNPTRLVFYDRRAPHHVDVFLDAFEMCHRLDFSGRLEADPTTIPLAELLLTKLQIVQLNLKDQLDIFALLAEHDVGTSDDDMINGDRVATLCSSDWGLWRTVSLNLERVRAAVATASLTLSERDVISQRLNHLWSQIEAHPKSLSWRTRNRVGDRKRWYAEPEEIEHDG